MPINDKNMVKTFSNHVVSILKNKYGIIILKCYNVHIQNSVIVYTMHKNSFRYFIVFSADNLRVFIRSTLGVLINESIIIDYSDPNFIAKLVNHLTSY